MKFLKELRLLCLFGPLRTLIQLKKTNVRAFTYISGPCLSFTLIKSEDSGLLESTYFFYFCKWARSLTPHHLGRNSKCHLSFPPVWLLCRLLESQLQSQKRSHENEAEALRGEIQSLKEENNRQQQLLAQNLQLPPEARIEASLQHEITRLTNENLVRRSTHSPSPICPLSAGSAWHCWMSWFLFGQTQLFLAEKNLPAPYFRYPLTLLETVMKTWINW